MSKWAWSKSTCRAVMLRLYCDYLYTYLFIYLYLYCIDNVLITFKEKEAPHARLCAVKLGQWQPVRGRT